MSTFVKKSQKNYYISGIFDLKKLDEVELDNPTGNSGNNYNYGTYLHMVHYDRPY